MQPKQNKTNRLTWTTLSAAALLVVVAALVFAGFFRQSAAGQPAPQGALDPLSAQEVAAGREQLALILSPEAQVASAPRQVVLMMERHRASKANPKANVSAASADAGEQPETRQAEGYIYNYNTDTLQRILIDLETSQATIIESVQDVQLPLVDEEKAHALALIRGDADAWSQIQDEYAQITGYTLDDLSQLETKIQVFQADTMPGRVNEASSHCGRHRCAQVLLFTHDRIVFEMIPIVDLSSESVVQLEWEGE